VVDDPKLPYERLESLPIKPYGLLGRSDREDLPGEAWYRPDAMGTPARIIFETDFRRLEASLIENSIGL